MLHVFTGIKLKGGTLADKLSFLYSVADGRKGFVFPELC